MNHVGVARPTPWAWMVPARYAVTLATLVVFGAVGGLMLLVALNGVSERTGGILIVVYSLAVLAGNFGVTWLVNLLIARKRYGGTRAAGWAPALVSLAVTACLLLFGPPLAVLLMKLNF